MALATNLGYPRIGVNRELKKATEGYWSGSVTADELERVTVGLRASNWTRQRDAGIDLVPSNDFSLYDHVLDTVALVGAVPERYRWDGNEVGLETYFAMARGAQSGGLDAGAMEMTKWFDTNYHYIVPEFWRGQAFRLASSKPFDEVGEARGLGIETRPVLLGPVSFLLLGKPRKGSFSPLEEQLEGVVNVFEEVVRRLAEMGVDWIQLDEPCLVMDRGEEEIEALRPAYARLSEAAGAASLLIQTYFGSVGGAYETMCDLPVQALGFDFARGSRNLDSIRREGFPADKMLSAGVVDGRNVWIDDLTDSLDSLEELATLVGSDDRVMVAPTCSLIHVPISAAAETGLDDELRSWLSFADEKLIEITTLAKGLSEGRAVVGEELDRNQAVIEARRRSARTWSEDVRKRVAGVDAGTVRRGNEFAERKACQGERMGLPQLPTTVIGSFPQHAAVRRQRLKFRRGELGREEYEGFVETEIGKVIELQERLGLEVLVHGEFERNDMVEYFGERLDGFAFSRNGWVQSFGSRYVKPPLLYGDVRRKAPITIRWWKYAQSLTDRPVKGMLTGPVTMLQWSFVRDDQPRDETCLQLALAIRDEVLDLETAGARVIQVDEPALREGLPLRSDEWGDYLPWAVGAFRVATAGVRPETQIHTHMCYSEFNDIIEHIEGMDADVLLIENARSDEELLGVFRDVEYARDIGPGVYDIHSPRIPPVEEMADRVRASLGVLSVHQLWVNPDCGLKTRTYEEVIAALENMVEAARSVRREIEAG